MTIEKKSVQYTLLEELEDIEALANELNHFDGYDEQSEEEVLDEIVDEQDELDEEELSEIRDALSDALFIKLEYGRVLIAPNMISVTLDEKLDKAQEIVREHLDDINIEYEEESTHALQTDNLKRILEIDLEEILGDYTVNVAIQGEEGNLSIMSNGETTVNGKKPLLEKLSEAMQNE